MTDEMKLKMMETLAKSGMSVGQFVMENNGTMTYNDHRGAEERKKDDACAPASKEQKKKVERKELLRGSRRAERKEC